MRYVIDCRCVFPGCGGIGNYAASLVRALARVNGSDEFILLRTASRPGAPLVQAANCREEHVPTAMLDAEWEQLHLPVLLEKLQADLYHNPTFALPLLRSCRLVTTIHDVVFHFRPELVAPALCQYLSHWTRLAADLADRIITVSQYSKQAIVNAYDTNPDKISVVYEAAEAERFAPRYGGILENEFRQRYQIKGPYVLYVGSLEPKKNLDYLLRAFAQVLADGTEVQLVLAGGGGGAAYDISEALLAFGVAERTVVTGFLPEQYLPVAYAGASLFVYPSLYEGFGLPPLEAMASGVPVIVSRATSLPEVVGEAGLLVDPGDPGDLARQLQCLLHDQAERQRRVALGLQWVQQFSWQRAALETLAAYRQALG